jgi:hypothetical protein
VPSKALIVRLTSALASCLPSGVSPGHGCQMTSSRGNTPGLGSIGGARCGLIVGRS